MNCIYQTLPVIRLGYTFFSKIPFSSCAFIYFSHQVCIIIIIIIILFLFCYILFCNFLFILSLFFFVFHFHSLLYSRLLFLSLHRVFSARLLCWLLRLSGSQQGLVARRSLYSRHMDNQAAGLLDRHVPGEVQWRWLVSCQFTSLF